MAAEFIGVDWGTSNFRAFRYDAAGAVIALKELPCGLSNVENGAFEAVLRDALADWSLDRPDILMCGMVGARQGWVEAPYAPCPTGEKELLAALQPVATTIGRVAIVPGVSLTPEDRPPDVMRGEETQILGAIEPEFTGAVVTPGTHSKWVRMETGAIAAFRTFMTGELHALLRGHSILRRTIEPGPHDPVAFADGVARALADPALSALLFAVRTEILFERLPATAAGSLLSGLLIGAEIAANRAALDGPIAVIASDTLAPLYDAALRQAGARQLRSLDGEDAAASGLWRLHAARAALEGPR